MQMLAPVELESQLKVALYDQTYDWLVMYWDKLCFTTYLGYSLHPDHTFTNKSPAAADAAQLGGASSM